MKYSTSPSLSQFNTHIEHFEKQLQLLKQFRLPEIKSWKISWAQLNDVVPGKNEKSWAAIPLFRQLLIKREEPAIYYFTTQKPFDKIVWEKFYESKFQWSKSNKTEKITATERYNLCHIPKEFKQTNCLYVGSVKKGLHGRLISHLGYGAAKTGAIFLQQVFTQLPVIPVIYFNYTFVDGRFREITENIERVMQDHLNPLIGQKTFKNIKTIGDGN